MIQPIDISKGVFKAINPGSLRNSEFAENLINLFITEAGGNEDRPTLQEFVELPSNVSIGMSWHSDRLIVVTQNRRIYAIETSSGTITDITGELLPGTARPTFASNGIYLFISGGGTPIKWRGVGFLTEALGGLPPDMTHINYLDGYLIGNRRLVSENYKVVQFSDFDDPEVWTGTNIFSNNAEPDPITAITTSQRELYVVGENSTEVWQNVGSSPVPFARSFIWQYGTKAPYALISDDNSVFMINQNRLILRLSSRQLSPISEPLSNELDGYDTIEDCFTGSFSWKGGRHVFFGFPTERKYWSYDLKSGQWTEWRGFDSGWDRCRINCLFESLADGHIYAGDFNDGRIYRLSDTEKTEAGGIFKRSRTFSIRDAGGSIRKKANWLRIKMSRDVASAFTGTLPETNPKVELRWKDDDKEWSNWRQVSLGTVGNNKVYAEFRKLGIYRTRQYEVQMSDPAKFSMISVETDEEVMTS